MIKKLFERKKNRIPIFLLIILGLLSFAYLSVSPPTIIQLAAGEDMRKVTFNAPLTLNFSHSMNKESVEEAFRISPGISGDFIWQDRKTLEFHPNKNLKIGENFRIILREGAKSLYGKKIGTKISIKYTVTGSPFVMFVSPGIPTEAAKLTPDNQAEETIDEAETSTQTNIPVIGKGQAITVMFDRPMNFDEVDISQLLTIQPHVTGEFEIIGMSAFEFTPFNLKPDQIYTLTIPSGIEAIDGGKTEHEVVWQLKPPSLKFISVNPVQGATNVDIFKPILIKFNQAVDLNKIKSALKIG